jgi:PAS domain S-box-containing protein
VASRWSLTTTRDASLQQCVQVERDLTEQKRLSEALKQSHQSLEQNEAERLAELGTANEAVLESQERFRQIGEAIPDVIWLTNPPRTSTLYVSPAYRQIWGRSCQSLYADPRSWLEGVHPEDRPRMRQFFAKHAPEQAHEQFYRIVRPDCSVRWVLDRGFPVRDHAGVCHRVVGILRDVTQHKDLEKEILAISEREQRRMGQDLHDDLCQRLAGTEFLSRALQEQLGAGPQAAQAAEVARLIREAINYTRLLAHGLAPVELAADGLLRGLQALASRTSEHFQVRCQVEAPRGFLVQDPTVSTHLYRIAQEAVANSLKHGHATEIQLGLAARPEGAELTIRDNGQGLPPGSDVSSGMGLRIMRYRADMIGATLAIESPAAGGTTIVCAFPLPAW